MWHLCFVWKNMFWLLSVVFLLLSLLSLLLLIYFQYRNKIKKQTKQTKQITTYNGNKGAPPTHI